MKKLMKIFALMWKYQKSIMLLKILIAILQGIVISLNVSFTQALVDNMIGYIDHTVSLATLIKSGVILGIIILVDVVFAYCNSILDVECEKNLTNTFEPEFIDKFCRLPYSTFEDNDLQNVIQRASDSPYLKMKSVFLNIMNIVQVGFMVLGICAVYVKISIFLIVIVILMALPLIWVNMKVNSLWWHLYFSQTEDVRRTNYFSELLCSKASLVDLKVFRALEFFIGLWKEKTNKMLNEKQKTIINIQKYFVIKNIVTSLWYTLSLTFGLYAYFKYNISFGLLVAVVQSNLLVSDYIDNIAGGIGNIVKDIYDIDLYTEFLAMEERKEETEEDLDCSGIKIVFDNVRFKYPNTDRYVLDGVSFEVNMNENVSIVGENGAGKSTIVKLLCKLYEPTEGRILINGVDLKNISYSSLHKIVGVIFQDFFRYELTVRENVGFGCLDKIADDEKILAAIQMSGAEGLLNSCKNGIDSHLGKIEEEGIDLSGGQWQRIALARAYITNAPMVILDEPTASLDPIAESNMYRMFIDIMKNHSTIMISHRLSSSRISNKVIVLDKGKVVEQGLHDELMMNNGIYKMMFNKQANWYIEENEHVSQA